MSSRNDQANAVIRKTNKDLDKQEEIKKENNKVKKFFTHTIAKIVYLVVIVIAIVWATLTVRQAIEDYNQHYIDKGIQLEKDRTAALDKEVAARSKQAQ